MVVQDRLARLLNTLKWYAWKVLQWIARPLDLEVITGYQYRELLRRAGQEESEVR
jgi:hypothetical protein